MHVHKFRTYMGKSEQFMQIMTQVDMRIQTYIGVEDFLGKKKVVFGFCIVYFTISIIKEEGIGSNLKT